MKLRLLLEIKQIEIEVDHIITEGADLTPQLLKKFQSALAVCGQAIKITDKETFMNVMNKMGKSAEILKIKNHIVNSAGEDEASTCLRQLKIIYDKYKKAVAKVPYGAIA